MLGDIEPIEWGEVESAEVRGGGAAGANSRLRGAGAVPEVEVVNRALLIAHIDVEGEEING